MDTLSCHPIFSKLLPFLISFTKTQISAGYNYPMELSQQSSKPKALPKAAPSVPSLHALSLPWSYDHSIKNFVNVLNSETLKRHPLQQLLILITHELLSHTKTLHGA
jgi:hypothetical protein